MVDSYYFVKYLPVDGKITDNSSVIFKINGRWTDMHVRFMAGGRVYSLGDSINRDYCRVVIKGPCDHFH